MIEPIVIKVVDKVPIVVSGPQYAVCDNSDYTVVWQLDEEWAQLEHRTMQVNYKDGTYERVLFTGDSCMLPAIPVSGPVYVGLFAGDIHTTRPARLLAVRSATTDSGEERDPMPNGYAQAIEALDAKLDKNQGADNAGKALVVGDDGNVVPGDVQGGGSLPVASPTQLGGVKPVAKTDTMTQSIGVDGNGGLYVEPAEVYYIDLEGTYPNYTCPVAMADIKAAYEAGKVLECRCALGQYTATLPLFIPMPSANTWIFSGSGALIAMNFPAQTLTIAIANNTVKASGERLARMIDKLPNPNDLIFTGAVDASYDGSESITVNIPPVPTALPNPNALTIETISDTVIYDGSAARAITIPSSGGSGGETWELINTFEIAEADAARVIKIDKDSNGNAFSLKEFAFRAVTNSTKTDGSVYGWFCVNGRGTYNSGLGGFMTNFVRHPNSGAAIANDIIGRALPFGLVYDHSTNRKASEGILATSVTEVHEVELAGYQSAENLLYGTFSLWGVRK